MNIYENSHTVKVNNYRQMTGIILLLVGGVLFLDRFLKTGWLSLLIFPALGVFLYIMGVRQKHIGLIIAGSLIGFTGIGGLAAWGPAVRIGGPGAIALSASPHMLWTQIGLLVMYFGIGWGVVALTTAVTAPPAAVWAMVPGGVLTGLGYTLLFTPQRWVDFVLGLAIGVGLPLLIWGILSRLVGLIIPGCLLLASGVGIYIAWRSTAAGNGLTQTGIMLSYFALGWALITIFVRWVLNRYIWWPLIPGGILVMVGMGLYIGGDPDHALGVISNTGSIALMIFGLYLLLMRKGIHH